MSGFLKAFVPMAIVWPPRSKCLVEIENVNVNAEGTYANTTEKDNDSEIKFAEENVSQPDSVR